MPCALDTLKVVEEPVRLLFQTYRVAVHAEYRSAHQMQELLVPFVQIVHVIHHLLRAGAYEILVLAAFGQMHLGVVVAAILAVLRMVTASEGEIAAHHHAVEEGMFLAVAHLQAHA